MRMKQEDTDLDQAPARAAAAAMEMRERAAVIMDSRAEYWAEVSNDFDAAFAKEDAKAIRALPIDPDAQKALDKMLAQEREDAIREAADACDWGDIYGDNAVRAVLARAAAAGTGG